MAVSWRNPVSVRGVNGARSRWT